MSRDMKDQVVVVTGGTSGIGLEVVSSLVRAGARVFVLARSAGSGPSPEGPGEAIGVACDFSAARALDLSSSTVSKWVSSLEEELGVRLLSRTTRQVTLTEAGREFSARCNEILAASHEAVREMMAWQRERLSGTLRIFTPTALGRLYLAPALAEFLAHHRELRLDLVYGDRPVDLVAEHIDAAISVTPLGSSTSRVIKLGEVERILCAAPAYLSAHGEPARPEDLARHRCLVYSGPGPASTWKLSGPAGSVAVKVDAAVQANSPDALVRLLLEGVGIGLPPVMGVAEALSEGRLRRVLPDFRGEPMPIQLVYSAHAREDPRVRAFASFLAERFRKSPPWPTKAPARD
jgi:DNA-binding transcriptional LysR family regulator